MNKEQIEKAFDIVKEDFKRVINEMSLEEFKHSLLSDDTHVAVSFNLTICKEDLKANTIIKTKNDSPINTKENDGKI